METFIQGRLVPMVLNTCMFMAAKQGTFLQPADDHQSKRFHQPQGQRDPITPDGMTTNTMRGFTTFLN
jgi:hypothetical protein